jgi:hypothetical protein
LYTVPQKVRPDNIDDGIINDQKASVDRKVDIFFRIRSKYEKAQIEISSEAGTITLQRGHMAPAEMERISLTKEFLQKSQSITIKVVTK